MFSNFDWKNVFIAGGSVLSCLLPNFRNTNPSEPVIAANGFHNTDIDLFIYGLSTEDAFQKVQQILETLQKNTKQNVSHILVSSHSITVIGIYPYRHIQIVLRLYRFRLPFTMVKCLGV